MTVKGVRAKLSRLFTLYVQRSGITLAGEKDDTKNLRTRIPAIKF